MDTMSAISSWMRSRTRWERVALSLWLILLGAIGTRVLLRPEARTTYPIFSSSTRLWWQSLELYHPHRPDWVQTGYRYSPIFAILMTPFAVLPDGPGGVIWRCFNAAIFLGALGWWSRAVLPRAVTRDHLALLAILVIPLTLPSANNGQVNVLVSGLLLATVTAVAQKRWNLASLCMGLAFVCKIYPLALGLILVLLYPRQLAARLALVIAASFGLPFLCQRPEYVLDQYGKWFHMLGADDRSQFSLEGSYRDLWLLIRQLELPLSYTSYRVLQVLSGVAVAALCWVRQRRGWSERSLLTSTLALATAWMLLLGPAPESCTFVLMAPSLAWALLSGFTPPRLTFGLVLIVVSSVLYLLAFSASWLPQVAEIHSKGLHPWATILWVVYLLLEKPLDGLAVPEAAARPQALAA
jgi:alpha-1,2-mannosyltransferase